MSDPGIIPFGHGANPTVEMIRLAKPILGESLCRERPALILTVACALQAAEERGASRERAACAEQAVRYASHYPQSSDGRNTFVLLAEWIEARALSLPNPPEQGEQG